MMRRLADLLLAVPAGLVLLPVSMLVALGVALTLGPPILFRQTRSGAFGSPFVLLKFRTMVPPALGADPLAADAERTLPLGTLLRRTRLDELPQLWNVIRGDMGIVGPRPLLMQTIETMGLSGQARGAIRPGLTGWAQLNGGALLSDADKLALDLWYVENRTVMLDMSILLRTAGVVLFGDHVNSKIVEQAHAGRDRRSG